MAPTSRFARSLADLLQIHKSLVPANRQAPQPAADGTWSVAEVAKFCAVSQGSVRKWIRTGLIEAQNGPIADVTLREILQHGLPPNRQEMPSAGPFPDMAAEAQPYLAQEAA